MATVYKDAPMYGFSLMKNSCVCVLCVVCVFVLNSLFQV